MGTPQTPPFLLERNKMQQVSITLSPAQSTTAVNPYLFGSFVEHMGRCVYGGVYDPDHILSDDEVSVKMSLLSQRSSASLWSDTQAETSYLATAGKTVLG